MAAACSASETSGRLHPWTFGACNLYVFSTIDVFVGQNKYLFAGVRVSHQGESVSLLAALRPPQENQAPGMLDDVPCVFVDFSCLLVDFNRLVAAFRVSQQGLSVWLLPAALRRPQQKTCPWNLIACIFGISASPTKNQQKIN